MKKPKISLGQNCYFAVFAEDKETGKTDFTVNSGILKAIEFDSETGSYYYYVESPFIIDFFPNWLRRLCPERLWICRMIRRAYCRMHREFTHQLEEVAVFNDIRDAIDDAYDYVRILEETDAG